MKTTWVFFKGTILSAFVFFSLSFITFLMQINPIHYYRKNEAYKLDVGFPFTYYRQFWLSGSKIPNSEWIVTNLLIDIFLSWVVVATLYYFVKKSTAANKALAKYGAWHPNFNFKPLPIFSSGADLNLRRQQFFATLLVMLAPFCYPWNIVS